MAVSLGQWFPVTSLPLSPAKAPPDVRLRLTDINPLITCGLCKGYLCNATTITECLHSFCKGCIVRHVEMVSVNCPTCGSVIHPSNPYSSMRLDATIQDIVYKLLPHIEQEEKEREKQFYVSRGLQYPPPKPQPETPPSSHSNKKKKSRQSASRSSSPAPVEWLSVHLEHAGSAKGMGALRKLKRNLLRIPALATIGHLQRFLDNKLNANHLGQVSLFVDSYLLHGSLTLHDIKDLFFEDAEENEQLVIQYGLMPVKDFFSSNMHIVPVAEEIIPRDIDVSF